MKFNLMSYNPQFKVYVQLHRQAAGMQAVKMIYSHMKKILACDISLDETKNHVFKVKINRPDCLIGK